MHPKQAGKEEAMTTRLSVGNLPHQMTEDQLQLLFSEAGVVASVKIIPYVHNGMPSGFGFVEMNTMAEGQKAILLLNGRKIEGRLLAVREDRQPPRNLFGSRARHRR